MDSISELYATEDVTKPETPPTLAEKYEDYEFEPARGRGGGGRKHNKPKQRDPQSRTSKAARNEHKQNAETNRKEKAKSEIVNVLGKFPKFKNSIEEDLYLAKYLEWLNPALTRGIEINPDRDLEFKATTSGKKAGGQNVNKVSSAVECTHTVTNISARNEETRDQPKNKQRAQALVIQAVNDHMDSWKVFVGASTRLESALYDVVDLDLLLELLMES